MKNKNIGLAYCRVSTEDQTDGISLDYQEQECKKAAYADGYTDVIVIRDEGKSGKDLFRKGIQEVIELAKKREFSTMYVTNSDRLARSVEAHAFVRTILKNNDVKLKYLNGQSSGEDASSILTDNMFATINQFYSDTTREKTIQAVDTKARAGYFPANVPAGYMNVENPDKNCEKVAKRIIVPHPKTAHLVTEAFKLYATGQYNVFQLNDMLHDKGLVSSSGKKLVPAMFYKMLKNRLYLGEIHWRDIHVKGKHQPLIDEATFDQVQKIANNNTNGRCRRRKYKWLLNGYIFCPIHNRKFTAEWHLGKRIAYYHCTNPGGCGKYIEKSNLEGQVADKFRLLEFSDDFVESIVAKVKQVYQDRKDNYQSEYRGLLNKRNACEIKIRSAEDRLVDGSLSSEACKRITDDMRTSISKVDSQINKLQTVQDINIDVLGEILAFTKNLYKTYIQAPEDYQKHMIGCFFDGFEVKDGVIIKERLTPLFQVLLDANTMFMKGVKNKISPEIKGYSEVIITNLMGAQRGSNSRNRIHRPGLYH